MYRRPEPLGEHHRCDDFRSEEPALDEWLRRFALDAQRADAARVYVTTTDHQPLVVVGYFALAAASIAPVDATERARRGQPTRRPIPAVLLARLARDMAHAGKGLGVSLLQDALLRASEGADVIGARVLLVHAKHARAQDFYLKYGFEPSPTDPLHLLMLMKDVRAYLKSWSRGR